MSVETWINLLAVVASAATLYFLLRRPIAELDAKIDGVEAKLDKKIDAVEAKLNAKIDGSGVKLEMKIDSLHADLTEFRIETREVLARHDERISSLERQRHSFIVQ